MGLSAGYGYLVVATATQCYVYAVGRWGSPHIIDAKGSVLFLIQVIVYAVIDIVSTTAMYVLYLYLCWHRRWGSPHIIDAKGSVLFLIQV